MRRDIPIGASLYLPHVRVERSEGLPADLDWYFKFTITFPQSIALTIHSRQADTLIKRVKNNIFFMFSSAETKIYPADKCYNAKQLLAF